jgi:YD repeat-containing protein
MKKIFSILLILTISQIVVGQNSRDNYKKEKIKKVEIEDYIWKNNTETKCYGTSGACLKSILLLDASGNTMDSTVYKGDGIIKEKYTFKYSNENLTIEKCHYFGFNDKLVNGILHYRISIEYDSLKNISKYTVEDLATSTKVKTETSYKYFYDDKKQLIEKRTAILEYKTYGNAEPKQTRNTENIFKYEYDKHGTLSKLKSGNSVTKMELSYFKSGKLQESKYFDLQSGSSADNVYNEQGQLIKETSNSGISIYYEYNKDGLISKLSQVQPTNDVFSFNINFQYNELKKISKKEYSQGKSNTIYKTEEWHYLPSGLLSEYTIDNSKIKYSYSNQ